MTRTIAAQIRGSQRIWEPGSERYVEAFKQPGTRTSIALQRFNALSPFPFWLEQLQLRLPKEIVILQHPNDLEHVGFLVVAIGFGVLDEIREDGVERNNGINAAPAEQFDALPAGFLFLWQGRHHQDLGDAVGRAEG